jgi:hypothetical protein
VFTSHVFQRNNEPDGAVPLYERVYYLIPPTILPSLAVQEAKEKRRKELEVARRARRENYFHSTSCPGSHS